MTNLSERPQQRATVQALTEDLLGASLSILMSIICVQRKVHSTPPGTERFRGRSRFPHTSTLRRRRSHRLRLWISWRSRVWKSVGSLRVAVIFPNAPVNAPSDRVM